MKATVITRPGDSTVLKIEEIEDPLPAPGQILVKVRATALNRADLLQRQGLYPPPPGVRADIPGLEFSGEVIETGVAVSDFRKGDRVMGLLPGGGYAQKVATPDRMAMPIPENLTFEEAASIPEVFITAYDALFRQLRLEIGETLLIHAVGSGVGIAALQLAKSAAARVLGTTRSKEKSARAEALGLDVSIDSQSQDFEGVVTVQTGNRGVDCVLDLVGASYWEKNLRCLASQGRMVLIGLVGGSRATADLGVILRKRLRIVGTVLRTRSVEEKIALTQDFCRQILPLFESGRLKPVIDRIFPFDAVQEAHAYMEKNLNFGKIVLKMAE